MTKRKENTAKGRTKHIDIRLTEDEYTMVVNKANECGLTLSDYGRRLWLYDSYDRW